MILAIVFVFVRYNPYGSDSDESDSYDEDEEDPYAQKQVHTYSSIVGTG